MARFSPTTGATSATVPIVGEVGQGERRGRTAGLVREQELGDLECDAAPGQPAIRVGRVRAMRIDDGERGGQDRAGRGGGR